MKLNRKTSPRLFQEECLAVWVYERRKSGAIEISSTELTALLAKHTHRNESWWGMKLRNVASARGDSPPSGNDRNMMEIRKAEELRQRDPDTTVAQSMGAFKLKPSTQDFSVLFGQDVPYEENVARISPSTPPNGPVASPKPLSDFLDAYKAFFQSEAYDELYKWQIARTVAANWDLGAADLAAMIDHSFSHQHQNLWAGAHYFPKAMLMEWAQRDATDCRSALRELLYGPAPLADRMRTFEQRAVEHVRKARPSEQLNTYQGMRAMALWLGMVLPEQHYLFKSSMVDGFCERTGRPSLTQPGDKYTRIDAYYRLCEEVRQELLGRPDIINAHKAIREATCHPDTEHHLLVQDFIYFVSERDVDEGNGEADFIKTLRYHGADVQRAFLNNAEALLKALAIQQDDQRVTYSCRGGHVLAVTIGQRYCLAISNNKRGRLGFIVPDKGGEPDVDYGRFDGPVERWSGSTDNLDRIKENWSGILEASRAELARTSASGFRKHSNPFFERAVFDPAYRASVLGDASAGDNPGLIMVNLTWNSRDWKGPSEDKSNHGFVKEGNTPMESWNFDLENARNPEGQVLGFVQHTAPPKLDGSNNLVVFHSQGKVVGFYGKGRFLKDKPQASDGNLYNIIGDRALSLVLPNKLEEIKAKGYLEDKQRMGQNGFIYLKEPATALRMIDEALDLNPSEQEKLTALRAWVSAAEVAYPSYWIFQGNPVHYDTAGALRAGTLNEWGVGAHKERIKPGDKVILWVTGPQGGCHALATVTSKVENRPAAHDAFYTGTERPPLPDRVSIRIDHDFSSRPVTREAILHLPGMEDFKAGNQGTTFAATVTHYDTIRRIAMQQQSSHPLNTILYGPPGTGKTYHAITHAVAIVDGQDVEAVKQRPREQVRRRYQELVDARLVRTVTFHQSFSYEDFVEGIKPETHLSKDGDEEVKQVTYEVQDGIFKLMCASARSGEHGGAVPGLDEAALAKANFYKVSLGQYNSPADDAIYAYCMEHGVIAVGYGGAVDVGRAKDEAGIRKVLEGAVLSDGDSMRYSVTVLRTMVLDMQVGDIVLVSAGNSLVRAIGRVTGEYFMDESAPIRFKQFRKVEWLVKDAEIPVEDLYPKSFVMGTLYSLEPKLVKKDYFRKAVASPVKRDGRYVLIIDEINRGNVASIFGELITLIEDDKREGGKEPAKVKLPYSKKDDFSVPSNLYLLGTMNTADRSVEALDTALRRRFSFVEMPSQPVIIEPATVGDVDLRMLLRTINERVEQLLDKDHHIGHSYFMGLTTPDDLKRMFATKVIPLLEEYFHGDAKKVGAILGEAFVEVRKKTIAFAKGFDMDEYEVKELYAVKDPRAFADLAPFKTIYAGA